MSIPGILNDASTTANSLYNGYRTAGGIIDNISNAKDVMGALRSINIPAGAEAIGDIMGAVSSFSDDSSKDWRVRLSLCKWTSFNSSPALAPLKKAGGLIFPYTPQVDISSSAKYSQIQTTHSNYAMQAYQNSDPGTIKIMAPMYVEDTEQALYWIAMVHYLRSLTKMFTGSDIKAGNPPPIVYFNGYGNYVFKNIPVVVTSMSVQLDNASDYISCSVSGNMASEIAGISEQVAGFASSVSGFASSIASAANTVGSIANNVGQIAGTLGAFGIGGNSGGSAHVPTKSSFNITLQPVYSRDTVRKFSLDRFVSGGYMNSSPGFL
jgi:hypothetical protein